MQLSHPTSVRVNRPFIEISGVDFVGGGVPLSLVIVLPPEFPKERPNLFLEPRTARHPWVREDGAVVGAPGEKVVFFVCCRKPFRKKIVTWIV
jgi:hypothetical protein